MKRTTIQGEEYPSVKDLMELLSKFPKDFLVGSSWEGQMCGIGGTDVWEHDGHSILVFNVDSSQEHEFNDRADGLCNKL